MAGFKYGKGHGRISIGFMRSARGTSLFKRSSPSVQKRWSSYDSGNQRASYKRKGFL